MTRLSGKTIITRDWTDQGLLVDFDVSLFLGAIRDKGNRVVHEKAYLCPCKSEESDHLSECKNCGGVGWIFANPIKTKMLIIGVVADDKYKNAALQEWGMLDTGSVRISAIPQDKLSYMDKITMLDITSEHQQILYPKQASQNITTESGAFGFATESFQDVIVTEGQLYSLTKYDIKSIDYVALFQDATDKLQKLEELADYTFRDNVLILDTKYNDLVKPCLTIRYVHNPVYHIMDIPRESMTSYANDSNTRQILPINAIGKRAHLIKDVENFDGSRLFDNSWLSNNSCSKPDVSPFIRQLRYTDVNTLYNNLTPLQKQQLDILLDQSF